MSVQSPNRENLVSSAGYEIIFQSKNKKYWLTVGDKRFLKLQKLKNIRDERIANRVIQENEILRLEQVLWKPITKTRNYGYELFYYDSSEILYFKVQKKPEKHSRGVPNYYSPLFFQMRK